MNIIMRTNNGYSKIYDEDYYIPIEYQTPFCHKYAKMIKYTLPMENQTPHFLNKIRILVFNAIFNNISAISWRPVLVVEEAGVPGENHRPWASNWSTVSLAAAGRVHPFCNIQSRARTHAVLVIGLYELLGNPTT